MSIRVMSRVWDASHAEGGKLLVLLALADRADEEGVCWPSVAYLAHKARISERQAQRLLRELEEAGDIRVEKRAGRGKTNRYRVVCGVEKVKPETPFQSGIGEARRTEKATAGTKKVTAAGQKAACAPPDSSIKESPINQSPIDSSSCGQVGLEEEGLSENERKELERIGVFPELLPEVERLVIANDIGEQDLLDLIQTVSRQDREGTPGALLVSRLRRYHPRRKKTLEDWIGG